VGEPTDHLKIAEDNLAGGTHNDLLRIKSVGAK